MRPVLRYSSRDACWSRRARRHKACCEERHNPFRRIKIPKSTRTASKIFPILYALSILVHRPLSAAFLHSLSICRSCPSFKNGIRVGLQPAFSLTFAHLSLSFVCTMPCIPMSHSAAVKAVFQAPSSNGTNLGHLLRFGLGIVVLSSFSEVHEVSCCCS